MIILYFGILGAEFYRKASIFIRYNFGVCVVQIKDKRNNLVTLSNQNSIAGLENFENELMGFSKHTIGVISELVERDPDCPLAFAYTAMCYLSGETKASNLLAEPFIRGVIKFFGGSESGIN